MTTARKKTVFSLNAAEKLNETLNAFLEIDRDGALARADELLPRPLAESTVEVAVALDVLRWRGSHA